MRAFAMRLVFNSSWAVNFERFPEKGEMFNEACNQQILICKSTIRQNQIARVYFV
jgi:hypothetical protein